MTLPDLNLRRKSVLLLTLVVAGLALLDGAGLREALGITLLGVAAAWALGSKPLGDAFRVSVDILTRASNSVKVILVVIGVIVLVASSLSALVAYRRAVRQSGLHDEAPRVVRAGESGGCADFHDACSETGAGLAGAGARDRGRSARPGNGHRG